MITRRREIRVPELAEPISHYTDAVRAGELLFISGQAPLDPAGRLVGSGDVMAQTRQVLENTKRVLTAVGLSFADVVKVTVFLTNMRDRADINLVRREYFGAHRPASSLVEVSALAVPGMLVEIESIAIFPAG